MTPGTVASQNPLSLGFSRQEYWSGLPFPSPGDLPDPGKGSRDPGIKHASLALVGGFFTTEPPEKPRNFPVIDSLVSLIAQKVKILPAIQETWVLSLSQEEPLEKGMATHSSILAGEFYAHRSLAG